MSFEWVVFLVKLCVCLCNKEKKGEISLNFSYFHSGRRSSRANMFYFSTVFFDGRLMSVCFV